MVRIVLQLRRLLIPRHYLRGIAMRYRVRGASAALMTFVVGTGQFDLNIVGPLGQTNVPRRNGQIQLAS